MADVEPPKTGLAALAAHPVVRVALPLLVFGLALFVLHRFASAVHLADVQADLAAASPGLILLALGATACSYAAVSLYDVVVLGVLAPGKVPPPLAAVAGASGFAISNVLGASWLTGGAVRMRIYAALGVDMGTIAHVIAMTWLAFAFGLTLVLGVLFSLHPDGIAAAIPVPAGAETALGLGLLLLLGVVGLWLARGHRQFDLGFVHINLPPLRLAIIVTLIAVADMVAVAATLYLLSPPDLVGNVVLYFVVFISALTLGFLSHAPGGIGVFEATMIAGLGAAGRSDMLASLLVYRVIYFFVPFVIAALGLCIAWGLSRRKGLGRLISASHRLAEPAAPIVAAGVALIAGAVLLASGSLPSDDGRLGILRDIVPLPFIEASHLIGSIAGVLLLVTARGLYRKLYRAWIVAEALLVVGLFSTLAKGLDWQEAMSMLAAAGLLALFRGAFYRVEGGPVFWLDARWMVSLIGLLSTLIWIGVFAHSHTAYRDALWWQFAWSGDASRFLRASLVAAVILGGISFQSLLLARAKGVAPDPISEKLRDILAACPRSGAASALTGDKYFLFSDDQSAFLAYADTGGTLIAQGDPVGPVDASCKLIRAFRVKADRTGRRCAFNGVSSTYLTSYLDLGLSIMKVGEVARVNLSTFSLEGSARKDFRHAHARATRDGLVFEVIPAVEVGPILPELKQISDAWLALKQGEEKGFSLGAFSVPYLQNFDIAILRRGAGGPILAFANLWQGSQHHEMSPDLMRYDPVGPGYVMDALFAQLLVWAKAEGFAWFSLGAAPFSGLNDRHFAPFWNRMGSLLYEHGEHFYHFEGLRAFKQKFDPVWTPHYLASPGGLAVPRVLYEINVLISGGLRGMVK
jgi:phosphatidylglycerol lysyltransferase